MQDQLVQPLEKAVWWVEYLIRHKNEDLSHLKGAKTEAYKYFLLDIIGFLIVCIAVVVFVIVKIISFFVSILRTKKVKTS